MVAAALACATPAERTDAEAARLGLVREEVAGAAFRHVVYRRPGDAAGRGPLHVYLGGDGSALDARRWRPPDPTPGSPVALHLMAADPAPSVFLGRPCYHGAAASDGARCHPRAWTTGRYGPDVVESLAAALRALARPPKSGVVLLGYSGGGTLALLLAERVPEVRAVVTVAANLDVAAWTALHGYTPFVDSLDPARRPPLRLGVAQLHVVGERDRNVPPRLTLPVIARQPGAHVLRLPGADHACCWQAAWPTILADLDALLRARAQRN